MRLAKLMVGALACCMLSAGCGMVGVEMTSSPDSVRPGDPVTFDIKITNHSACPVRPPVVELVAFLSTENIFGEIDAELPPDAPPELVAFFEELKAFFEELCAGGNPTPPDPPMFASAACARDGGEMVCTVSRPLPGYAGDDGSMAFATQGNRLRCSVDAGTLRCEVRLPLAVATDPSSTTAMAPVLDCLTSEELSSPTSESGALCVVGSVTSPQGLAPGEMASAQVTLPARGGGPLHNVVFVVADDAEDVGVCKGGSDFGQACQIGDSTECPGSTCGAGICDGGANGGHGCDAATAAADCPGANCVLCAANSDGAFLPIDCTDTRVALQPVPAMAPWALGAMAAILLAAGTAWLRLRGLRP